MRTFILFFLITAFCQAQSSTYWFSIKDSSKIPSITQSNGYLKLDFNNNDINNVFSKYNVIHFKQSIPSSKNPLLLEVYEITTEDSSLIDEIKIKFSTIFHNIEKKPEVELLYLPDDFGANGGELQEQEELNYIYAQDAWDISTGNNNIIIGISESVNINHEDLVGQSDVYNNGYSSSYNGHGTSVALLAGGKTDNNTGISSIGFNSFIRSKGGGINAVIQLAEGGVKVINMSWGSCLQSSYSVNIYQMAMTEAYDFGAVLIAAAGNGAFSCSNGANLYHYPAANDYVIAVTTVGHLYELNDPNPAHNNQKDRFEAVGNVYPTTTYNDRVDISAPGRSVLTQRIGQPNGTYYYGGGTSFAAPIVAGTVALMFDENYCLTQDEVETVLKLTSRKIDNLGVNQAYYGQIGSGVLNAYEAVKMSKDMADEFGTVEVKDRILYRWKYVLETAPYEIKMTNNSVTANAQLGFKARNNIEILSGDYFPQTGGYIDLIIDDTIDATCAPPSAARNASSSSNKKDTLIESDILVYPNPTQDILQLQLLGQNDEITSVQIYNIQGHLISEVKTLENNSLNLSAFKKGMYLLKISTINKNTYTKKVIKM
ncbi:MAG: subtilisin family serine protease [Dokdonia sp.]|jgi:subtilisin family serine protease